MAYTPSESGEWVMTQRTDNEGNQWYVPIVHWDRSRNNLGLSREDLERMTQIAQTHPALNDALEHAKMLWMLVDTNRRPDEECYPKMFRDKNGREL